MFTKKSTHAILVVCLSVIFLFLTSSAYAEETATLTLVNVSTPAILEDYKYDASGEYFISSNDSATITMTPRSLFIFQVTKPTGYLTTYDCGDHAINPFDGYGFSLTLGAGDDVTCTFTNVEQSGSIAVKTESNPAGATGFDYVVQPASGDFQDFTQDDGETQTFARLPLIQNTSYTIVQREIRPGSILEITCNSENITPFGENGVTVHLQVGEEVLCIFKNTDNGGSITIRTLSDDAGTFEYFSGNFERFLQGAEQSTTFDNLLPNSYIFGQETSADYTLVVTCDSVSAVLEDGERTIRIELPVNGNVTCTFANTYIATDEPPTCDGQTATIYVDRAGIIVGGLDDGQSYAGVLRGTDEADVIVGTVADDHIFGGNEQDLICAGAGNDVVEGQNGKDTIFGAAGDDLLLGGNGKDYLDGGEGTDTLDGGKGKNTLVNGE